MLDWPHSPVHRLSQPGAYMVTAGTYLKRSFFRSTSLLDLLTERLLEVAERYRWKLQAWAVFSNHYHFATLASEECGSLREFVKHLHSLTAIEANRRDGRPGRKVWFNYWDTQLTYQKSFFARHRYVHGNAVHHKVVRTPAAYPWCSAGWFETKASRAFYRTIMSFPCDRIKVPDDFTVEPISETA